MTKIRKRGARLGAGAIVAAVALALAAPSAYAAPATTPPKAGDTGSLTIYKHEAPGPAQVGDGTVLDPAPTSPLAGATFTVTPVDGIDLSTNAGWVTAAELSEAFKGRADDPALSDFDDIRAFFALTGDPYSLGSGIVQGPTAADGKLTFANLPIGVYLVEETGSPTQNTAGEDVVATPAQPFLVTIPITTTGTDTDGEDSTNNEWLYDVTVYPKNSLVGAKKSVEDDAVRQVGDVTEWTITGDIAGVPVDVNGDGVISGNSELYNIKGYTIVDQLHEALVLDATSVEVSIDGATPIVLVEGTDYNLVLTTPANLAGETEYGFHIQFLQAGLDKLMNNNGGTVTVTFETTVDYSKGATDLAGNPVTDGLDLGKITNKAQVWPNGFDATWTEGQPGGPVTTNETGQKFGGVLIHKQNEKEAALKGAIFEVYTAIDADGNPTGNRVGVDTDGDGAADIFQWTSGDNGNLRIDGLRYSAYANGADVTDTNGDAQVGVGDDGYIQYYLVEVQAPTITDAQGKEIRYSLLPKPVAFTVDSAAKALTETASNTDDTITNVPLNGGFELPLTGGTGMALLFTVGGLLAGGGLILVVVMAMRRKRAAEAAALL